MPDQNRLRAYARGGHRTVAGWLDGTAIAMIAALSTQQERAGIRGGVCEIGIHHGRLFILLHLLSHDGERCAAYDLFEMQAQNVDGSGLGDEVAFRNNLLEHGCDLSRIVVKSRNSLELRADEILEDVGPVRLFSVDGGHTADITANDLALADAVLGRGGLVILDDFFNEAWPGVAEGASRYLSSPRCRLVPVAIGGNKFIFAHADFAERYRAGLEDLPGYLRSTQHVFGADVVVIRKATRVERLASTRAWKVLRATSTGRWIRSAAMRVLRS
ncbi:MAG TPA: class I SAM-dependent methyltransferase [Caldimonas sp.]|jgi:hypothetical protein|nr:class I SAM-dependent methyltransferase [Caldimonas sp.]HEX2542784.1 class I SAM-dependent methyltransferase [Caldimonas sp.]